MPPPQQALFIASHNELVFSLRSAGATDPSPRSIPRNPRCAFRQAITKNDYVLRLFFPGKWLILFLISMLVTTLFIMELRAAFRKVM